jgi:Rrf2 family transcriptional regulator, nitric oxide-sensitive transcriptional repressor
MQGKEYDILSHRQIGGRPPPGDGMRLTSHSNYALRALQFAALRGGALVRIDDLARAHRISRTHLTKIVNELGQAGYLETLRGRNGGFRLARPAEAIIVGEVVRLTEGPIDLVECFNVARNTCPLIGVCQLSAKLREATAAFFAVLDALTIADIAANRGVLLERLARSAD